MAGEYDIGLTVTLPDTHKYAGKYTLTLAECTGIDDIDLRRETGFTVIALFRSLTSEDGMGAIVAASVVWLVRRRQFRHLTFADIAASMPWGSDFELEDAQESDPLAEEPVEGKAPGSEPNAEMTAG